MSNINKDLDLYTLQVLRHHFAGKLNNIRAAAIVFDGILTDEEKSRKLNEKRTKTAGDYIEILERDADEMTKKLDFLIELTQNK